MQISSNLFSAVLWRACFVGYFVLQTASAFAYKVEKVCEESPATLNAKSVKKCKFVVVRPVKEGEEPKDKKEEAPAGHGAKPAH
jgi:hypothetical protein